MRCMMLYKPGNEATGAPSPELMVEMGSSWSSLREPRPPEPSPTGREPGLCQSVEPGAGKSTSPALFSKVLVRSSTRTALEAANIWAQSAEIRNFAYTGYLPPAPEPSSFVLAAIAEAAFGWHAWRKRSWGDGSQGSSAW